MIGSPHHRAPWVTAFAGPQGVILYNGLTGRSLTARGVLADTWAALGDDPCDPARLPPEAAPLLERGLLVPVGADPRALADHRYPILCRWASFLHAPGRRPVVALHTAGTGAPWRARRLDDLETYVWINCRGELTVGELLAGAAAHLGPEGPARAWGVLQGWLSADQQQVKLLHRPVHAHPLPRHFFAWIHDLPRAGAAPFAPADPVTPPLRRLLSRPGPALQASSYAAALVAALERRRALPAGATVGLWPEAADLGPSLLALRRDLRLLEGPPVSWPAQGCDVVVLDEVSDPAGALAAVRPALSPGGGAWILAAGDPQAWLGGAEAAGYGRLDLHPAGDWLGLTDAPVLSGPAAQIAALRAVLEAHGRPLPLQPFSPEGLARHLAPLDLAWLHHLSFTPARTRILACETGRLVAGWAVV